MTEARHDRARYASLTVGALGLNAAEFIHEGFHGLVGSNVPQGYGHQISEGGEPTARYVLADQYLLTDASAARGSGLETKLTFAASVGFLTEGSLAISSRWGQIHSPWWSFQPELTDYITAPSLSADTTSARKASELYGFAGIRLKARAFNAFLQGQFRSSDIQFSQDELNWLLGEAWIGVGLKWSQARLTYALRCQTPEIKDGVGARELIWAGLQFEFDF
jgi:hypothetical protein